MKLTEKRVVYQSQNSYETLNSIGDKTKNIWIVFHGMGYLSRFFIRYFSKLNPEENYIIAPQAPSKYYLKDEFKYVGASWLTKENTQLETENVLNYIDAVFEAENVPSNLNLVLFGFSQGVSIVTRWMVRRKIRCHSLVLYAGGIPKELVPSDFDFMDWESTKVTVVYGDKDHYLTPERRKQELEKMDKLFLGSAKVIHFEGGHEVKPELLSQLI
ncbi:alpha/beta hydrolase [Flagellimonas algicola]|uniref:Esterase n=1 Tax=Flagellimonas algicola TaxID=2583815 RepID=A0ABY2WMQ8_9FLAO|nr:esterase [Allomuricauda algicola]TMU56284.1 esterase [Allomuricauda algicola]